MTDEMEGQDFFDEVMKLINEFSEELPEPVIIGHLEAAKYLYLTVCVQEGMRDIKERAN